MTEPRRTRADAVDRLLSVCAGIAAVTAVAVSLYQSDLARRQLRASAWPYLSQSNSFTPGVDYTRLVRNDGVGPARVRGFEVRVDGRPVPTWAAAVRALAGTDEPRLVYSSFGRGSVLPAGASLTSLTLPAGDRALAFWTAAQTRLETVVCYCSVYDECSRASSEQPEPAAVRACAVNSAAAFRQ